MKKFYNSSIEEKFNELVEIVCRSNSEFTTCGMFDDFYNLCKNFVKEVDDSYNEGKGNVFTDDIPLCNDDCITKEL